MTDEDARVAREVIIDELKTINKYEGLQNKADSEDVKDVVKDITREEKVHVGEASELLRRNDKESMPALKEGAQEAEHKEASARQKRFNPSTGNLTDKMVTGMKSVEDYDNSRWANMTEEAKKRTDPDRYERERRQKRASVSFRDVFAQKRGEVIAKANGDHIEKDANWKHAGPEAVDYVEQKKMPNTEFLRLTDHPMDSIENYRAASGPLQEDLFGDKPYNAIYGAKYSPKGEFDSEWQEHINRTGFDEKDFDTGEIYTVHPDSRTRIIHNPQEYDDFVKEYELTPDDMNGLFDMMRQNGYGDDDLKVLRRTLRGEGHPLYTRVAQDYDHVYFPADGWRDIQNASYSRNNKYNWRGPIFDTNTLITLNDYLADGKTPTRILQRPYTPREQRVAQDQQDDSRHDYVPEEDVPLGFMAEGGREPKSIEDDNQSVFYTKIAPKRTFVLPNGEVSDDFYIISSEKPFRNEDTIENIYRGKNTDEEIHEFVSSDGSRRVFGKGWGFEQLPSGHISNGAVPEHIMPSPDAEAVSDESVSEVPKVHDARQNLADIRAQNAGPKKEEVDDRPDLGGHVRGKGSKANPEWKKKADKGKDAKEDAKKPGKEERTGRLKDYSTRQRDDFGRTEAQRKESDKRTDDLVLSRGEERRAMRGEKPTPKKDLEERAAEQTSATNAANGKKIDLSKLSPEVLAQLKRDGTNMGNGTWLSPSNPKNKKRLKGKTGPQLDYSSKSASDAEASATHIEKKKNPSAEAKRERDKENNKKASPRQSYSLGVHHDPFKGYFNTSDPAFGLRFDPSYGAPRASGTLYVTRDPSEFPVDEYDRYNKMGGQSRRLPKGRVTNENYTTLSGSIPGKRGGGGTQQVTPIRVQAKDMFGNPIYDERYRIRYAHDDNGMRIPLDMGDGTMVWMPQLDEQGNVMYDVVRVPRMVFTGMNTILTQRGKDMAYLQRYTGRLDTKWDRRTQQFVPIGIEPDKDGNIPDALFEGITDENGRIDPDLAMARARELGYRGADNRWNPDLESEMGRVYRQAAYEQLVKEGVFGPDSKIDVNSPDGKAAIERRAVQIRAGHDKIVAEEDARKESARQERFKLNRELEEQAHVAAQDLYDEWFDSLDDVDVDEEGNILATKNGVTRKYTQEYLDNWVDANEIAFAENFRINRVRAATEDEKAKVEYARRGAAIDEKVADAIAKDATYKYVAENGHAPSSEELAQIRSNAEYLAHRMDATQKMRVADKVDEAVRQKDWSHIISTLSDMPLYMHPDDIYHRSLAHDEDLKRMRTQAEKEGKQSHTDMVLINALDDIQELSENLLQEDETGRTIRLALDDLGQRRLIIRDGPDGPVVDNGVPKSSGNTWQANLQWRRVEREKALIESFINSGVIPDASSAASIEAGLRAANKTLSNEYLYDAAMQLGYSPEMFRYIKGYIDPETGQKVQGAAGAAERRQVLGGNTLSKIKPREILNRLSSIIDTNTVGGQANGQFGPLDEEIRQAAAGIDEADRKRTEEIVENSFPAALRSIRSNLRSGRYAEKYGPRDLYYLDKFVNGTSQQAQEDILWRLLMGKPLASDPHFTPDLAQLLQKHLLNNAEKHRKRGRLTELYETFADRMRDAIEASSYRDALQAGDHEERVEPVKTTEPSVEERLAAVKEKIKNPQTPEERNLRTLYNTRLKTLVRAYKVSPEEAERMLDEGLVKGNFEKIVLPNAGGNGKGREKQPTSSSQTLEQGMHVSKPENVRTLDEFKSMPLSGGKDANPDSPYQPLKGDVPIHRLVDLYLNDNGRFSDDFLKWYSAKDVTPTERWETGEDGKLKLVVTPGSGKPFDMGDESNGFKLEDLQQYFTNRNFREKTNENLDNPSEVTEGTNINDYGPINLAKDIRQYIQYYETQRNKDAGIKTVEPERPPKNTVVGGDSTGDEMTARFEDVPIENTGEDESKRPKKEPKMNGNDNVLGATGKSASFHDIFMDKRSKVLKKYHGI